jgi:hypothetical protein
MTKFLPYMKALVAILGAAVTTALVQLPDSAAVQTYGPIVASILTALSVYLVPNKDPQGDHQDESTQPPSDPDYILGKA